LRTEPGCRSGSGSRLATDMRCRANQVHARLAEDCV
jgi:hypothetical protein